jgi:hypothetical protein
MRHHIVAFLFVEAHRRAGDITRIGKDIMCRVSSGVCSGNKIPSDSEKIRRTSKRLSGNGRDSRRKSLI